MVGFYTKKYIISCRKSFCLFLYIKKKKEYMNANKTADDSSFNSNQTNIRRG